MSRTGVWLWAGWSKILALAGACRVRPKAGARGGVVRPGTKWGVAVCAFARARFCILGMDASRRVLFSDVRDARPELDRGEAARGTAQGAKPEWRPGVVGELAGIAVTGNEVLETLTKIVKWVRKKNSLSSGARPAGDGGAASAGGLGVACGSDARFDNGGEETGGTSSPSDCG